jgi:hypothetical protein
MARPLKDIEPWQVYKLARIGCTDAEIGTILGCSEDTLTNRFSEHLRKGREKMRMSLRRMQYKAAQTGNITMLIWLGKQYLKQSDKIDIDHRIDVEIERELARLGIAEETGTIATPPGDPNTTIH